MDALSEIVTVDDFSVERNRLCFMAMCSIKESAELNFISVAYAMAGGTEQGETSAIEWLLALTATSPDLEFGGPMAVAKLVAGMSKLRKLKAAALKIAAETTQSDPMNADAMVSAAVDSLMTAFETNHGATRGNLKEDARPALAEIKALALGTPPSTVMTGIDSLDRLIGGFQQCGMVLVGADTGHGKTALSMAISFNAVRAGMDILFVTMEVKVRQLTLRVLSMESRVDGSVLRRAPGPNAYQTEQLKPGVQSLNAHGGGFHYFDGSAVTVPMVTREIRRHARHGRKIGMVVLDYGQRLIPTKRCASREQEMMEIADRVMEMAKEHDCVALVPLQLNREWQKRAEKRPFLNDIRESSRWAHNAEVAMLIHRPSMGDDSAPKNVAEIIVAKNRNDELGTVKIHYDPAKNFFADLTRGNQ
jgi:replicative DNA helicase